MTTDIDEFLHNLASSDPVPGGGSVAGFEVAMGAALLVMVCELTLGREKFEAVAGDVQTIRARSVGIQTEARDLVDADADAFGEVATVMKMPRTTDEEKARRRDAMQTALKKAVDPPLRTMLCAHECVGLARTLAPIGNPSAVSDVGSAALALYAGYHAAKLNVEINLAAIRNQEFIKQTRSRMPDDQTIDRAQAETLDLVLKSIRGLD